MQDPRIDTMNLPKPDTKVVFNKPSTKDAYNRDDNVDFAKGATITIDGTDYEVYFAVMVNLPNHSPTPVVKSVTIETIPMVDDALDTDLDDDEWAKVEDKRTEIYDEAERALCQFYGISPDYLR